ncbi:hypothetical protein F4604DRAFT_1687895 [Suillus subluteus]|nr:hypothetical protein F4604DRAFT_1687895 [Suillus subluteus]
MTQPRTPGQTKKRQQQEELTKPDALLRSKNKNVSKCSTMTAKVPTIPVVIPSNYTVQKLKAGDYCELYYFTNKGLNEAKKNLLSTEPQGMILLPGAYGQQTWVNVDETCDSKTIVTKDKNLTWEELNEATPCMITAMQQHEWPEDHVNMHISFWTALQNHCWHHTSDILKQ